MFKKQELYGGAIVTVIPEGFLDASILREVPDTQEVFVNSREDSEENKFNDGLGTNESVIIDLLQAVDEPNDREALSVHIQEITSMNGSNDWKLVRYESPAPHVQTCIAVESAYKWGKRDMKETLVLCLALLRLEKVQTDVVLSVNVPLADTTEIQAMSEAVNDSGNIPPRIQAAYTLVKEMADEFKVLDESLFV